MLPADVWPPSGLTITTDRLTLAPPTAEVAADLVRRTRGTATVFEAPGVPWAFPWLKSPARDSARHLLALAASLGTSDWALALAATVDGELAGCIDLRVVVRDDRRFLETGSYLLTGFHGRGLGTSMRRAAMALAFRHIGTGELRSVLHPGNAASRGVSRACGYVRVDDVTGPGAVRMECWRVTPETADYGDGPITVTGWTPELAELLPPP